MQHEKASLAKVSRITRENTMRLINSRVYNVIAKLIFGLQSMDINGTPKIIRSKYVKHEEFISTNIAFDLELLLKIKKKNVSWIEIPVFSQKRKTGFSTTNLKSVWEMFSYMLKFKLSKDRII